MYEVVDITNIHSSNTSQVDTSEDDTFSYKAQRWLWNKSNRLQLRYLKLDLEALVRAAEKAVGPEAKGVEVTKLPEGNLNKTLFIEMQEGGQYIARLPSLNAGPLHNTTASEVATMNYIRDRLQVLVPKILAYNTQASTNEVRAEYIIMAQWPGVELGHL